MNEIEIINNSDIILKSGVSQEEILQAIEILKKDKLRKEKKENKQKDYKDVLKGKALRFIKDNYMKHIFLEEGEGYFIIAHSKKIKFLIEHNLNIFQPQERQEYKDVCTITILQYDKVDNNIFKKYLDINCETIVFRK